MKNRFKRTALAAAISSLPMLVQADALVSGKVQDATQKKNFEGALVTIKELGVKVQTNQLGEFNFPKVKSGDYTVVVDYLGYQTEEITISVADDVIKLPVKLKHNGDEEILVYGQAAAAGSAINRQKNYDGVISVMDAESMGNFADQNVAESLKHLPGVGVINDQGEGRYVSVRGMDPNFNSVAINGVNVPSPEAGSRAVALDVIPNDLVSSIQVTKTVSADKDADSLGGAIEVQSLSAFDKDGLYYKVYAEASYNELMEETSPKLGATVSDTFNFGGEEDVLGVAFAMSYYDREFGSENVETGGKWVFDADTAAGELNGLEEFEQRDYEIERERLGMGLNFDYKLSDTTELYLRTLYSTYTDTETRLANVTEFSDPTFGAQQGSEVVRELKNREEEQEISSVSLGGSSIVNGWIIDYNLGYSEASENEDFHIDGAAFKSLNDIDVGFSDSKKPRVNANAAYFDPAAFELDEVEMAEADTNDTQTSAKLDFTKEFYIGNNPAEIKFGSKFSQREKDSDETVVIYDGGDIGAGNPLLSSFSTAEVDYSIGRFGPGINVDAVLSALNGVDGEVDVEKSSVNDYTINEDIQAAYAMLSTDVDAWRLIAGLRYEGTSVSSDGYLYVDGDPSATAVSFDEDYDHLLPSLIARYDINEKMLLRAAWTNTIARPTFEQISPGQYQDGTDIESGNPELEAMESSNVDITFEFYPGSIGVASLGLFYKDISDFIYATELEDGLGNDIQTWDNGESADLYGLEANYVKRFDSGVLLGLNATFIDSEATVSQKGEEREVSLPNQSDLLANVVLGYELDRFSLRLSGNYKSEALIEIDDVESEFGDAYEDDFMQWDFVGRVKLVDGVSTYLKVVNLTDEPYYAYQYKSNYNFQYEEYGRTLELGIEITNF